MSMRRLQLVETADAAAPAKKGPRLRVAIATQDLKSMNAHFNSARRFAVYEVSPHESRFIEAVGFDSVTDESGSHKAEGDDRIASKVAALAGCNLLFVLAIGGPAAAKVVNARIHPVKLSEPEPIDQVIARVQGMMTSNPPPWLRKAMMAAGAARSMHFLDEED
ncbi:nitrogen fixation protein NifX [Sorangium sp. So ce1024]|uniref:nitrogen fixation protein NifX n=1 Tax=unclassified Sorangium TaxID=2621164 RepID=UPI003F0453FD